MMAWERPCSCCPKFTLVLKSRGRKRRLMEAAEQLKGMYPFSLAPTRIVICRTSKKSLYDVYVSDVEQPESHKTAYCITLFAVVLAFIAIWSVCRNIQKNAQIAMIQKEKEMRTAELERARQEKETRISLLENEFRTLQSRQYEKIYPRIKQIYDVMSSGSIIEQLSIDPLAFSIEVTTKDALAILGNFENSLSFGMVKMNRTTIKDSGETVIYTGVFPKIFTAADETLSLDEKLDFYAREISSEKRLRALQENQKLSAYIERIRKTLRTNGCAEQYIQLRGTDNSAEVEFFVLSSSRNMLKFLQCIQEDADFIFDIKQIRIRNSELLDRVQTTVCFDSGIKAEHEFAGIETFSDKMISAEEIDAIFYKKPVAKPVAKSAVRKVAQEGSFAKKAENVRTLAYVGLTKMNGETVIIAKDEMMGSIVKLPMTNAEIDGDFCVPSASGFKASFRGEIYEVKK